MPVRGLNIPKADSRSAASPATQACCFVLFVLQLSVLPQLVGVRYHSGDFPERIPWDSELRLKKLVAACVGMRVDMRVDMRAGMHIAMHIDTHAHMHV